MRPADYQDSVGRARQRNILDVARELGAKLRRSGSEWIGPCPCCGGEDRFGVNQTKGLFICRGMAGGDVIAMVEHVQGFRFREAVEFLTGNQLERLHQRRPLSAQRALQVRAEREREQSGTDIAKSLWDASGPIGGTLAERYLRFRGIDFEVKNFHALRFHRMLSHRDPETGERSQWPALICAVTDAEQNFKAIWRIYLSTTLNPATKGKAPVKTPRMGLGPAAGGAVWLGTPGKIIKRCEGVETGLGVLGISRLFKQDCAVACCLSTSGLINFSQPAGVQADVIYADGDSDRIGKNGVERGPGMVAADKALWRALDQGLTNVSIQPVDPDERDWLDIYRALREAR